MDIRTQYGAPALLALFALAAGAPNALAQVAPNTLPTGATVTAGSAVVTQPSADKLQINQSSDKAIIDWRSYSIGSQAWVNYTMPGAGSISLNRVTGGDVSHILGKLTANGTVMLINPNGIVFGKGSTIDVAGLVATTANIRNDDFMAGRMKFTTPGKPNATIINEGTITIREAGLAALVAPGVENRGVIEATLGKVSLGAGNTFTLDFYGDGLIKLAVTDPVTVAALGEGQPLVRNSGTIKADGGKVLITANAAKNVVDTVINMDGVIQARRVSQEAGGAIVLDGGANGEVRMAGRLDVSATKRGVDAGKVTVTGEKVRVTASARIDATALEGKGGEIKIGGDYQGKGTTRQARLVTVDAGAIMDASAVERGDGGTVVVWSTEHTKFNGTILAKGGQLSGNGGLVETSGKILEVGEQALVSTLAANGATGTWLLDPTFVIVDLAGADGVGCVLAVCTISPATLEAALALSNVTLQADIGVFFNADVTYTGPNTLTLNIGCACAGGFLEIADSVTVTISNLFLTSPRVDDAVGITINYAGVTLGTLNVTTLTLQTDVDFAGAATWNGTRPTTVNVVKHPDNPSQTPVNLATEPQGGKIQDGIDIVADGGTVAVGPGTFTEELVIGKNLTLNGNNVNVDPRSAVRSAETIIQSPGTSLGAPLITINYSDTTTSVSIVGFTFDGLRSGQSGSANWVPNLMLILDTGGAPRSINFLNNIVQQFQDFGIKSATVALFGRIDHNIFQDIGASPGCAICLTGASGVSINNNTFLNIADDGAGPYTFATAGKAVVLDSGSGNTVFDNSYTNVSVAVAFIGTEIGSVMNEVSASFTNVRAYWIVSDESKLSGAPGPTVNVLDHGFAQFVSGRNLADLPPTPAGDFSFGQFSTIQNALDFAAPGGIVTATAGTFQESLIIRKNVTLRGNNWGIDGAGSARNLETIVQSDAGGADLVRVAHNLAAVTIDGLLFDGRESTVGAVVWNVGVHATYTAGGTYNLAIRNNIFRGFFENGIQVEGRAGIITTGLLINQNGFTNIGCACDGAAILLKKNVFGTISNNLFDQDLPSIADGEGPLGIGIEVRNYDVAGAGDTLLISGNTIKGFDGTGLILNRLDAGIVTVNGNTITGDPLLASLTGISIVNSATAMSFSNNTVQDVAFGVDIVRGSSNLSFADQTIFNATVTAVQVFRHSGNIDFIGTIDITSGALFVLDSNTGGVKSFTGTGIGFRSIGGDTAIFIQFNTGGTYIIANVTITDPVVTGFDPGAVIITDNQLDVASPSITLRNFNITVSDPSVSAILIFGTCGCGSIGNILIDPTTITAAGTAIAILDHVGIVTLRDTTIYANTANNPFSFGVLVLSSPFSTGDLTVVLDKVTIDLPTIAPAPFTAPVYLFATGAGLMTLSLNPTNSPANRVSLIGGAVNLLIEGPTTRIEGNTLRDTAFSQPDLVNDPALFYIVLSCCALFDPGQPTVIDASRATFNGLAPAADLATVEARIEHFRDNPALGLFNLIPLLAGQPTTNFNFVLATLLAFDPGAMDEIKYIDPFKTSFHWPWGGPYDFETFKKLFPLAPQQSNQPLGDLAPALGPNGMPDACMQLFMTNFWAWQTQCAVH